MTRREAERLTHLENTLVGLGFTLDEARALRRISLTLHRWSEHECNGTIQRDGENGDGRPYWFNPFGPTHAPRRPGAYIADRERGALKRLAKIVEARNARSVAADKAPLSYYVQGDPRGCALWILRPADVPTGEDAASYYTRGIAVY